MEMPGFTQMLGVIDFLLSGLPILLIVMLLPLAIYNQEKGEYKGFLNPLALFWIAVAGLCAWRTNANLSSPIFEAWEFTSFMVVFTILGARWIVEEMHRKRHGDWLHKQGIWLLKKSDETG